MAKIICTICGNVYRKNRSKHLRDEHGVDTSTGTAVSENFERPETYGISLAEINTYREGAKVVVV